MAEKMDKKQEIQTHNEKRMITGYMKKREHLKKVFGKMSLPDFVMLQSIFVLAEKSSYEDKRIYLKILAENMELSIPEMSKVVTLLQDKGYVIWKHDADSHEGTYITVSQSGMRLFQEQRQLLQEYLGSVMEEYGRENTQEFLTMLGKFEEIAMHKAAMLDDAAGNEYGKEPLEIEVRDDFEKRVENQLNDEMCLIMDAQQLVSEVSLDLKELATTNQLKEWEIKLLESEIKSLRGLLENLDFDDISAEELQKIKCEKEQIEKDAEKLL